MRQTRTLLSLLGVIGAGAAIMFCWSDPTASATKPAPAVEAAPENVTAAKAKVNLLYTVNNLGYTDTCG